jgi:4-amino-4-deoxy-L-arabinose transferase-like glycosyltransferase
MSSYGLGALLLIIAATALRCILIYFNWPTTNSDEGNMGVLALHIAYKGEWPIFFYGLPYMGPIEGYIAAPLFRLFGSSLFVLRLGLVPFYILFLVCMYWLVKRLYTQKFAFFSTLLLSVGSSETIFRQLKAVGEYPETIFFAALISLLVVWIAQTTPALDPLVRTTWRRSLVYGLLGLTIGVAIWVDMLILPVVGTGILLLLLFCRRELRSWAGISLLLGMIVGAFPLIVYNATAPFSQNSLFVLYWLQHANSNMHYTFQEQILGAVGISIPDATNFNPMCITNGAALVDGRHVPCAIAQLSWGSGFLLLFIIAFILTAIAAWQSWEGKSVRSIWQSFWRPVWSVEQRERAILNCSRFMLLLSAAGTILSYVMSPASAVASSPTARYLTCLLIALPAVLWPLWKSAAALLQTERRQRLALSIVSGCLLLVFFVMSTIGTYLTVLDVPSAQAYYAKQADLVKHLEDMGVTRFYSEYWTCNNLIFQSNERLICSSLSDQLLRGFDRYIPYRTTLQKTVHPGYVFPKGAPQIAALDQRLHENTLGVQYQRQVYRNYVIYYVP